MRGKAIGSEWYQNDRTNCNKLYIEVYSTSMMNKQKEREKIYKIISSSKGGFLEYIYIVLDDNVYKMVAKFKDKYASEQKARLRKTFFELNQSKLNIVENIKSPVDKVHEISKLGELILIKGPAFVKELDLSTNTTVNIKNAITRKQDELKIDFIEFMKKNKLMILENSNIFVNSSYKHITYDDIVDLLCKEQFFDKYKITTIERFYNNIQKEQGIISSYHRRDFPIYRPRRRYLEFADCIYDTFTLKRLSKNQEILDSNSTKPVHPCYKFDKTFIYYSQCIPYNYFIQVAKMMEPEMFEQIFNQFTNEFIPTENCTIITYPHKTNIFQPLINIYDNVTYKVDETNATCFDMSNCLDKEILFTQNVNVLKSFKKNAIFKDKHVLQSITDGKSFETPIKYKEPKICTEKIVISIMDDEILYIPPYLSSKILCIELPKDSVKLDPDEFTDDHIGGCIITNMMTNKDEIKQYIKNMRYENNWDKPIKLNGRIVPTSPTQEIEIPKNQHYAYTFSNYEKYETLDRI